jgi:antitoxin VapB
MAFHIRNRETEWLTRELAKQANIGLTEAVHVAVSNEIARRNDKPSLWERTAALRAEVTARVKHKEPVSKGFRDSLYE